MADVKIRKLDDWVLEAHRARAQAAGRSVEEELRRVLTEAVLAERRAVVVRLRRIREQQRERYGTFPDSTPEIRAERESWS